MCGIAGVMTVDGTTPPEALSQTLATALAHRGPDGTGFYASGNVALAQTRLAIIDLATGDQPFREPDGGVLIANAEIYNYVELRTELADVQFTSQSDCEVPLHLYRRQGLDFTQSLRGMYAIAIHDAPAGRLILARDPFGIKPLYYAETPDHFLFASEPEALLACGVTAELVPAVRDELVQLQFTTGAETIYAGIKRLLPGETLVIVEGRIVERRRRQALPPGSPVEISLPEALAGLDAVLLDSVRIHQRADVPYGMFLSGGIDSTALLSLMARLNDRPVQAFTAWFPGTAAADERAAAREAARSVGAEHVEIAFGEADFWRMLPQVAASVDDPTADYALLPTYRLAEAAKAVGLKVILSGEGGDELFAGYGRYRSVMRPWWAGGKSLRRHGVLDRLGVLREPAESWRDGMMAAEVQAGSEGRTRLQVAQATDCADWLPNDLLTKLDRCLMANGIEGRTPFLDPAVAAFAFRLPDALKIRGGFGKFLLRQWLQEKMPQADALGPKRGFTVPVAEWIWNAGPALGELVAAEPGIAEICRPEAVRRLFGAGRGKHAGFGAWTLLFYALWHRVHIQRLPIGRDVFETLSERS